MSSPNITDVDITRGKTELKASILYAGDSNAGQLENIAQQALFKGRITSNAALAAEVDKISAADVKKVCYLFLHLFFSLTNLLIYIF